MEIAKYKKIKAAYEKANKSIIELVDTTNELDPNCSLFGDILLDLDGVQALLEMQEKISEMEKAFNREFMRLQKNRLIENQAALLSPPKACGQMDISEVEVESEDKDPLTDVVMKDVMETGRASVSRIQRQFKIGYNRAARLMESLEKAGIVSSANPDGNRIVLIESKGSDNGTTN